MGLGPWGFSVRYHPSASIPWNEITECFLARPTPSPDPFSPGGTGLLLPATCVNTGTAISQRGQSPAVWEAGLFLEPVLFAAHSLAFILSWFLRLCSNMLVGPGDPGHSMPHYSPRNM